MLYNIALKAHFDFHEKILMGINEIDLKRFVDAYENGLESITISGEKVYINSPSYVKIFNISKRIEPKTQTQVKSTLRKWANIINVGIIDQETFEEFGEDITSDYIKFEFGEKKNSRKEGLNKSLKVYIDLSRIDELKKVANADFDLTKLIRLCEEINSAFKDELYLATGLLVRALIDHVPPIFGAKNFSEVANNYKAPGSSKSFKDSMEHLDKSMRKISDKFIHSQITKSETLPNETQIDCKRDLDVLLEEIVRILKNN